ncbi:cell division protein SepF [Listeria monocytogenes]|uniref:cell division protein SepF n=1 Tax=Listeria monocytogenes TaxID=1639 RepID=UPI0008748E5F|nr:cell division protein SepF [Listeria monocytogenes]EAC2210048.1 cell division protein SepF [Listeria monocytogenes]EAC8365552.1 cell division protein SepF [Listeria monocytogenes]EAD0977699.1 cell division protein SepF [Listeria monocytogenes]EAD0984518.1 cell division protein SepF [Listeria monocytogenes]EAD3774825.1 cell division protein SepF [Listeria monocytogenes]
MGLSNKFKSFFFLDEEEEYYEEEVAREPEPMQKKTKKEKPNKNRFYAVEDDAKVVSMQGAQFSSRMVLAEPRVYAEAQELADYLKEYKSVVVNLQRISHDQATRIVDFLSGTVYALGGDIQRVGNNIFLCTPDNVEVDGSISEMLDEQNFM